jgi:DNA-binding transcriptional regulator PaaX
MGIVEKEAKRKRRWGQVQKAALAAVGISGALLIGMAAPNVLQLLKYVPKNKYRFANQAKTALSRLASQGYVEFIARDGKRYARLTAAGQRMLQLETLALAERRGHKKRWDKRWRVVMFDIPERRRSIRDSLRSTMRSVGFYRLQDSVWIYPHDCEDVVALLKADLEIGHAVLYMVVEHLDNDKKLREEFGLK